MRINLQNFAILALAGMSLSCQTEHAADKNIIGMDASYSESDQVVKTFNFRNFNSLDISMAVKATYVPGNYKVELKADKDIIDKVKVDSKNGVLTVGVWSGSHLQINSQIYLYVSSPKLRKARVTSAASLDMKEGLPRDTRHLDLVAASAGSIHAGTLSPSELSVYSSSAGCVSIDEVKCESVEASSSSSGNISVLALKCDDGNFKASSAARMKLSGVEAKRMECEANSSGEITLNGKAEEIGLSASSGANIKAGSLVPGSAKVRASSGGSVEYKTGAKVDCQCSSGGTVKGC